MMTTTYCVMAALRIKYPMLLIITMFMDIIQIRGGKQFVDRFIFLT
ncbi:hypothetical protein [Syntrophomonas wolfei]|nr:hypothetical protein [Syntrophomonas wolfei]